jgi:nicotinamidase-related amidase
MSSQDEFGRKIQELGAGFDPGRDSIESRWGSETEAYYSARGFGTRVGFGNRPVLLVIDMTRAFCDPSYKVGADLTRTIEAIEPLLQASRLAGVPVFYTTIAYRADGGDGGILLDKIPSLRELRLGDPATSEFDPRIAPAEGDTVIEKKFPSAFFGTSLASMLVARGTDTLVLAGCSTSGCIRATAIDGVSYGYRVIVPEEAVADRVPGPHYANLFDINAKYGDVLPLAEVLERLAGAARQTPQAARTAR